MYKSVAIDLRERLLSDAKKGFAAFSVFFTACGSPMFFLEDYPQAKTIILHGKTLKSDNFFSSTYLCEGLKSFEVRTTDYAALHAQKIVFEEKPARVCEK